MLFSMVGTTLSYLVLLQLQQAEVLRKDFRVYVGSVTLDRLFEGGSIAFNGLLHTYIADYTSPGSSYSHYSQRLEYVFNVGGAQLTMLPPILAGQEYLILSMITYILVAVLNVIPIISLLPETLRSPAHKLPDLKAGISHAVVILRQPRLTLALFLYVLTPD
ncbi:hypothetical protein EV421DRAFT_778681 [Armillaria borealis]|uniref:Uncharacterized protein n=1 Tax=Armillaria borealis TaxID=47425 RepID=A0AA39JHE2_9AGAR|nr:hypothetical protein EV421DRAFT_778681 [Armillaria borealis]